MQRDLLPCNMHKIALLLNAVIEYVIFFPISFHLLLYQLHLHKENTTVMENQHNTHNRELSVVFGASWLFCMPRILHCSGQLIGGKEGKKISSLGRYIEWIDKLKNNFNEFSNKKNSNTRGLKISKWKNRP